jgi:hypothetical protein
MKTPKVDTSGTEQAQKAIAEAQAAASNLQKNFATDLKADNVAQVTAAGTADDAAPISGTRKRKPSSGLASQLGVNV